MADTNTPAPSAGSPAGDATPTEPQQTEPTATGPAGGADETIAAQLQAAQEELERWKAQARKHEDRAKANKDAVSELERVKREAMSEQERAVADAAEAARQGILRDVGAKLVHAEIRAAAAGRLPDETLSTLTEAIDVARFLGDGATVDTDAVKAFVDGLVPPPPSPVLPSPLPVADIGQGAGRGGATSAPLGDDGLGDALKRLVGLSP
ncbi:MAG: hypothetical protein OEV62_00210 [Actinomycetota bacterium]|nr:hypothetical protein [Actinomycetota bacterium]